MNDGVEGLSAEKEQVDKEDHPFVSVAYAAGQVAMSATNGVAVSLVDSGDAAVLRYGIAYATNSGTANGGAAGVALSKLNGLSKSGDGGVSVAHHYGDAETGYHGVAYSQNPGAEDLGAVKGLNGATLVISWVKDERTYSKSVRVGDTADCTTIEPGRWYSLDWENCYEWREAVRE